MVIAGSFMRRDFKVNEYSQEEEKRRAKEKKFEMQR